MKINNQLIPKDKGTNEIDKRYEESVKKAVDLTGKDKINKLVEYSEKVGDLQKEYAGYAYDLVIALHKVTEGRYEKWQRGALRKQAREFLKEIGFKPSAVSQIVGAAEFQIQQIEDKSAYLPMVNAASIRTKYELSRLSTSALEFLHKDHPDSSSYLEGDRRGWDLEPDE